MSAASTKLDLLAAARRVIELEAAAVAGLAGVLDQPTPALRQAVVVGKPELV